MSSVNPSMILASSTAETFPRLGLGMMKHHTQTVELGSRL